MSEELKNMELNAENLEEAAGGLNKSEIVPGYGYRTQVYDGGYLALRSYPSLSYETEIGALYNGSCVEPIAYPEGDYVYVRVRSAANRDYSGNTRLEGREGWVNWHYLITYRP